MRTKEEIQKEIDKEEEQLNGFYEDFSSVEIILNYSYTVADLRSRISVLKWVLNQ